MALDVDGTLLTSRGTISPATHVALRRAQARGLSLTLATGRRLSTAQPHIDDLGVTVPVILQSGAQVVDPRTGTVLYSRPLPPAEVSTAVRIAVDAGVQPILYEDRTVEQHLLIGPDRHDSPCMRSYVWTRPDLVRRLSYAELFRVETALELAVIDDLPTVRRVAARMQVAHCRTLVSYSANLRCYFLEVFHAACSKGAALRYLAAHLGIPLDAVVAVGDNYNDREMLRVAGLGVAMANAEPEILALADRVTASNDEDGIATLLDEL